MTRQELTGMGDYAASPDEYGFDPSARGAECGDGYGDGCGDGYGDGYGDGSCDQFGDPTAGCDGLGGHRLGGWLHGACACEQNLWR